MIENPIPEDQQDFQKIISVLERRAEIDVLPALVKALKYGSAVAELETSAIIIDANAVLRIPGHRKSSDIIDYLRAVHKKPIIVPGQVVQEFWNNQLNAVATIFKGIQQKTTQLDNEILKAKSGGILSVEKIGNAVDEFKRDNEHLFDPDLIQKTSQFLEALQAAIIPHAPRLGLYEIALQRKFSKTPPGFRDDGDGDFLVWVDSLWGLCKAKRAGAEFHHVILLTNDKKIDWCRGFAAHPILCAEMSAIIGVQFEVWTLDHFAQAVG